MEIKAVSESGWGLQISDGPSTQSVIPPLSPFSFYDDSMYTNAQAIHYHRSGKRDLCCPVLLPRVVSNPWRLTSLIKIRRWSSLGKRYTPNKIVILHLNLFIGVLYMNKIFTVHTLW